ncbi:hypothetical protein VCRA2110O175_270058 [Vibrio crassostreae]|nr:hypothetical protein VCRA2110O175_270058 [Vibrio crassostreae]
MLAFVLYGTRVSKEGGVIARLYYSLTFVSNVLKTRISPVLVGAWSEIDATISVNFRGEWLPFLPSKVNFAPQLGLQV